MGRRRQKTVNALTSGLRDLLRQHPYDAIRISTLVDHANIGRSTFYDHFADKNDLMQEPLEAYRRFLEETCDPHDPLSFCAPTLRHAAEHRDLYTSLRGSEAEGFVMSLIEDLWSAHLLRALPNLRDVPRRAVIGGFKATLIASLEHESADAVDAIAEEFMELYRPGLS